MVNKICNKQPSDLNIYVDGFGGLVVQTRPKPLDFSGVKILSMPSFGGEVK
jgi:hypothetical protein